MISLPLLLYAAISYFIEKYKNMSAIIIHVKSNIMLTIIFGKCKMKHILQMPNESEKK